MHAWFPRFFWGTWKLTVILVHVAQPYITESRESLQLFIQQSCVMCPQQGWKAKNGTEGVFVWYRQIRQVHMYEFLLFVFMPHIHFEMAEAAYCHHGLASYMV